MKKNIENQQHSALKQAYDKALSGLHRSQKVAQVDEKHFKQKIDGVRSTEALIRKEMETTGLQLMNDKTAEKG